jgi:hypothetical protein
MCVKVFYRFWIANIALQGVICFTGIHFSLGSFMSYSVKVLDQTTMRELVKSRVIYLCLVTNQGLS